jgi:hypothetical protein
MFLQVADREILQHAGKITAKIAQEHAETEFEKYRIVQDRLFESDFDRHLLELEKSANCVPSSSQKHSLRSPRPNPKSTQSSTKLRSIDM